MLEAYTRQYAFLFIFSINFSNANSQSVIKGQVKSNKYDILPAASIKYLHHQAGTKANLKGEFEVVKIPGDTLIISHVGYNNFFYPITDTTVIIKSFLLEKENEMNVSVIRSQKTKTVSLGYYSKYDKFIHCISGNGEYGVLIPNKFQESGFITEIKFRLIEYKNSKYNLRVKLLGIDTVKELPSDSLSLFVKDIPAIDLQKVNKISIPNNYIHLPPEGVVVALQWIAIDSLNAYPVNTPWITGNKTLEERRIFNRLVKPDTKEETWFVDNKWKNLHTKSSGEIILYVPNISIEAVTPVN